MNTLFLNHPLFKLKYVTCLALWMTLISCKTVSIHKEAQNITTQNISLGTVGVDKGFIIESDYNNIAIPQYVKPIKVHVSLIDFNKRTFKAFDKAQRGQQSSKINLTFNDTLKTKPKYLKVEISDRLAMINSFQDKNNKNLFELLKNNKEVHLVTSIAIVFNQIQLEKMTNAEEVFLETYGVKSYSFNLYASGKLQQQLLFNEGVVFAYQTSHCCWKQNDKYQLEIIDLVEDNDQCPNSTFRSAEQAEKKINYFKF